MLGAVLALIVWLLFFVVSGLAFLGLFGVIDWILTWAQVPVVTLALLSLYESGIPGGAGELKSALAWIQSHEPDEEIDFNAMPANTVVVALELGAGTLALVGLALSLVFALAISASVVGAFQALFAPSELSLLGIQASNAFGLFLAGAVLWHVAMFVEASSLV